MPLKYPDAATWAREHSLADTPLLARLESYAFQRHPEIVALFGMDGHNLAGLLLDQQRAARPVQRLRDGVGLVAAVVSLIAVLSPLVGVAAFLVQDGSARTWLYRDPPAHDVVPVAVISFTVAVLAQIGQWISWLVHGARWSPWVAGLAAMSALCGLIAAVAVPTTAARDGYAMDPRSLWPVWATIVLSALLLVATLTRLQHKQPDPPLDPPPQPPTPSDLQDAEAAVRTLPDAELAPIRRDRDEALHILRDRGLITEDTVNRSLDAPLGTLFALDPLPEAAGREG